MPAPWSVVGKCSCVRGKADDLPSIAQLTVPQVWCRCVRQAVAEPLLALSWPLRLKQGVQGPKCPFLYWDAFSRDPVLWSQGHSCSSGCSGATRLRPALPTWSPSCSAQWGWARGSPGQHVIRLLGGGGSGPSYRTNRKLPSPPPPWMGLGLMGPCRWGWSCSRVV